MVSKTQPLKDHIHFILRILRNYIFLYIPEAIICRKDFNLSLGNGKSIFSKEWVFRGYWYHSLLLANVGITTVISCEWKDELCLD